MATSEQVSAVGHGGRVFATTRWTVVLQAGGPTSEGSTRALEHLCRTYWYPLYSFARRSGLPVHDAEDLTQSFFAYLLEKDLIARADRERGRFRTFLLTSFKYYRHNELAKACTLKRGGGRSIVSFDELRAETRYQHEPANDDSPEKLYEQKWAASLLHQVMQTLRAEYESLDKGPLFDVLRGVVWGDRPNGVYAVLAQQAGLTEGAFKVAVHRLRVRFKECLRLEVAQTVATPGEVDDELHHLLSVLTV